MIISWIFGVGFGLILSIGSSNSIPNKKPCFVKDQLNCTVLGDKNGQ